MLHESLRHASGVGPIRLAQLHESGIRSWDDVITQADQIPPAIRHSLVSECQRCAAAHHARDLDYFVTQLHPQDKWRILAEYLADISFFDIETDGLELDARITVISCWHRGALHTFLEHENLDDFLVLLDEVTLLASYNGNSFDVPRLLDAFHIPALPCPHLDLRWPAFHQGYRGGLKQILRAMNIERPADLVDTDGEVAIDLWHMWQTEQNTDARNQLMRYCGSDVIALLMVAHRLAQDPHENEQQLWDHLPALSPTSPTAPLARRRAAFRGHAFGLGSPGRIRAFRSRRTAS